MFKVETIKKVTVTEQIMEQIAQLITSGQLQPGEKLPNERDLGEHFGVTRARVREALRALSLVGLITIKAGEGSFVNKREEPIPADTITWLFHKEIHNLDEIYAARKLIETEIYLSAARNITAEQIAELENMINAATQIYKDATPEQFMKILNQFDLYIGDICGNRVYAKLMQTVIHLRKETSLRLLSVPGAIERSIKTRSAIIKELKIGDMKKIKAAVDQLFITAKKFYESIASLIP